MANNSFSETRNSTNKSFIIDNSLLLQQYAKKHHDFYGAGIVVINLLLLKSDKIDELNLLDIDLNQSSEITVHQPVSYIPQANFWFKMINLKIQKKHQIDLHSENNTGKTFVVFIKDDAIEYFSVYKIGSKKTSSALAD